MLDGGWAAAQFRCWINPQLVRLKKIWTKRTLQHTLYAQIGIMLHTHWRQQMRTTLDLPETLVQTAMKACHHKTKTAVIIAALQDLVRKSRLQELRRFKGMVDLNLDLNTLRKRT
jgi:Arc/MetJ family transcription regulator